VVHELLFWWYMEEQGLQKTMKQNTKTYSTEISRYLWNKLSTVLTPLFSSSVPTAWHITIVKKQVEKS
jgi:hypothetical protein